MKRDLAHLIGIVIHECGALEFLTNNAIMALGQDRLLSSEIIKKPFAARVQILRRLLLERTELSPSDINSLCNEIVEIAKKRNAVAHNPILRTDPAKPETEHVLVVRHAPEKAEVSKKISGEDLEKLVKRASAALLKFSDLVPASTSA